MQEKKRKKTEKKTKQKTKKKTEKKTKKTVPKKKSFSYSEFPTRFSILLNYYLATQFCIRSKVINMFLVINITC